MGNNFNFNLDDIAIAAPCNADWSKMTGDERKRVCADCKLSVYNISELSRKEATELIRQSTPGSFCIKLYRRADGTILTKDCPIGLRLLAQAKHRLRLAVCTILSFFTALPAHAVYSDPPGVERFGFYVRPTNNFYGPRSPFVPVNAGEEAQGPRRANYTLADLFARATEFEKLKNKIMAQDFYENALRVVRTEGSKHDPKFVQTVVSKYCRFLRHNGETSKAKEIEKLAKSKKLIQPAKPINTKPIPDNE